MQENEFENVVSIVEPIFSRPQRAIFMYFQAYRSTEVSPPHANTIFISIE